MSSLTRQFVTPNEVSRTHLEMARQIALHCPPQMGQEIALSNPASRGTADVELNLWVDKMPTRMMRDAWVHGLGGKQITHRVEPTFSGIFWSNFRYQGLWIAVGWQTFTSMENLLGGILAGHIVDAERFCFASMLETAVVLREKGNLSRAKNMLLTYPEAVQAQVIRAVTEDWRLPQVVQMHWELLQDDDCLLLLDWLIEDIYKGLRLLYALNRTWEPERQEITLTPADLPRRPDRLVERINEVIAMPLFADNLIALFALLLDILALMPPSPEVSQAAAVLKKYSQPAARR